MSYINIEPLPDHVMLSVEQIDRGLDRRPA
jgi:hypothetical protein